MIIEIKKLKEMESYQVRIIERLNISDNFHKVERITTSPTLTSEVKAQNWLIKYLSR